jgi:hypothetical protein
MQPYENMMLRLQSLSNCSLKIGAVAQGAIYELKLSFLDRRACRFKHKSAMEVVVQVRKGNQYLTPR